MRTRGAWGDVLGEDGRELAWRWVGGRGSVWTRKDPPVIT